MITHGRTLTIGTATYSIEGCASRQEATRGVYRMAYACGDYKPAPLREKWWQFWRPTERSELDAWLLSLEDTQ